MEGNTTLVKGQRGSTRSKQSRIALSQYVSMSAIHEKLQKHMWRVMQVGQATVVPIAVDMSKMFGRE
eukprot:1049879-Prorocentrum_lima.AAC.1